MSQWDNRLPHAREYAGRISSEEAFSFFLFFFMSFIHLFIFWMRTFMSINHLPKGSVRVSFSCA